MSDSLGPEVLGTYFALMDSVSLLQHAIDQQIRAESGLSRVQFQLLARLAYSPARQMTMTEMADGVVYSRSGITYQVGLLEQAGLLTRAPSPDDDRSTLVTVTDEGVEVVERILPGHREVVRRLLVAPLSEQDLRTLGEITTRVLEHMRAQPPRSAAPRKRRKDT
jgi:DNA-binding MarR family transcriptional regulator